MATLISGALINPWIWSVVFGAVAVGLFIPAISYILTAFPDVSEFSTPEIVALNSSYETVRGKRLRIVRIKHQSSRVTCFFFHGFGGRVDQWHEQMEALRSTTNIVAVDLAGHGLSELTPKDDDYTADAFVRDLEEVFKQNKTDLNIIVSHSYGTAMTAILLPGISAHVHGVVLIGTARDPPIKTPPAFILNLPDFLFDILRLFSRLGGEESISVTQMLHKSAPKRLKRMQLILGMINRTPMVKRTVKGLRWAAPEDWRVLSSVPVLLITGVHDRLTSLQSAESVRREIGPSARLSVVEDAGHNVMLEKPAQVNRLLALFVNETTSAR